MKAVQFHELGGPEVLKCHDVPDPKPGPGEALVRVEAAGINFSDTLFRQGLYTYFQYALPQTPGTEVAGEVIAVGDGVDSSHVGRRVMVILSSQRGYAQYVTTSVDSLMDVPDGLSFPEAAAIPIQGISAHQMLRYSSHLQPGETVLMHAVAGGVGSFVTQMARILGARLIIGTASTAEKLTLAKSLGAHHGVNYLEEDFVPAVLDLTDGRGADVIIDGVGGEVFTKSIDCLALFGRLVVLGTASGSRPPFDPTVLIQTNRTVVGYFIRPFMPFQEKMDLSLREIGQWIGSGELKPVVGTTAPLSEAAEMHHRLVTRRTTGKLVLLPWS